MLNLIHILTHAQLVHVQWATEHGYRCWVEIGVHFKHGGMFTSVDDVICRR